MENAAFGGDGVLTFRRSGLVLEKVCEYLYYNAKHKDAKDVADMDLPMELVLELLMAADYLNGEYSQQTHEPEGVWFRADEI